MGQTVQNTPSSNAETLQTLQKSVSQVPSMTVAEATTHFESQKDKLKEFLKNEKNPELKTSAQNLLNALENDIAILQKENQNALVTTSIQKKLASLNVDIKKEQTPAPGVDIPVTKEAPKPLAVNIDNESVTIIQNFQKEAALAFKKEISDTNGNLTNQSIKKGLEFVSEVSNISSITLGNGKFDWLDEAEKEKLKEQLPAVRGILGAIFMETLFGAGYVAAFNGDGTIVLKSKNVDNANTIEKEINTAFGRDPELSKTLRIGLLYADGDLLKYMQASADSKGQNILPTQQTPDEFLKYLGTRSKKEETQAADAIKASKSFFEGINLPEQMVAANAIPEISRALETIKAVEVPLNQQPQAAGGAAVQAVPNAGVNQTADVPGAMTRSQALASSIGTMVTHSEPKKTSKEWGNELLKNPIGTVFSEMGAVAGNGIRQVFSSPSAIGGAVIAMFFLRWLTGSWGKAFGGLAIGTAVAGGIGRYGPDVRDWFKNGSNSTALEKAGNLPVPVPVPIADPAAVKEVREGIHGKDNIENAETIINKFNGTNHFEVLKYIDGDKNANLSKEQKEILDDPANAAIVKKEIQHFRDKAVTMVSGPYPDGVVLGAGEKDALISLLNTYTVEQLRNFSMMTPEQLAGYVKKQAEYQLANDASLTPEEKSLLKEIAYYAGLGVVGLVGWFAAFAFFALVLNYVGAPGMANFSKAIGKFPIKIMLKGLKLTGKGVKKGAEKALEGTGKGVKKGAEKARDLWDEKVKKIDPTIMVNGTPHTVTFSQMRAYNKAKDVYTSMQTKIVNGQLNPTDYAALKSSLEQIDEKIFRNNTEFMKYLERVNRMKAMPADFEKLFILALKKIS